MNDQVNESSENSAPSNVVPEGFISVALKYNFRRFPHDADNLAAQIPQVEGREIKYSVENKKDADGNDITPIQEVFKRETETYQLLIPTPQGLGFSVDTETDSGKQQAKVLQSLISTLVDQYGRKLVNEGVVLTQENCNWEIAAAAEAERLSKVGTSAGGVTYSKELLEEVADSFADYLKAEGKPEEGITAMTKMVKGRFNVLSTRKYIKGLDMVRANLELWYANHLTAEEQTANLEVTQYLIERLEAAKEPEEVDTGNLF